MIVAGKANGGIGSGTFYPKKPLRSFQDLEVYQKTLEASVHLAKAIRASKPKAREKTPSGNREMVDDLILKNLLPCALGIPHQIAEAHSLRFGDHIAAIVAIEKAMLNCNKIIVYIEQYRDICESGVSWEVFDELIKKYLAIRRKMLNLERSWKKFMPPAAPSRL